MIINHNMNALNAHRSMVGNTGAAGKSMEKLSSGLRINRAGDDAAGLAISEKMRGQIRGLDQAQRNSQDGISLIQTAEGALNETHSILQRMRELAVQGGNDTNNTSDRGQIQKEIEQLTSEINRISNTTEFNTKKLLNGDTDVKAEISDNLKDVIKVTGSSDKTKVGTELDITDVKTATGATATTAVATNADTTEEVTIKIGDKEIKLANGTAAADIVDKVNEELKKAGIDAVASANAGNKLVITSNEVGSNSTLKVQDDAAAKDNFVDATPGAGTNAKITVGGKEIEGKGNTVTISGVDGAEGLQIEVLQTKAEAGKVNVTSVGMNLQIGANEGQNISLSIGNMSAEALGVSGLDLSDADKSDKAVTTIQSAIDKVSSERSKLGAVQNRLEHTINNLGTSSENLTAAESRIRDVDMAKEMMTFSKNNILQQAAQAMLAQANQQPQGVLQLLR
ncbi:flagellin [Clostridium sp. ATCC 25772]|uniref:flagellin N-terminal helical domain-containing protein n=1 Tax=Clostridium sp. ATCC 25772 TaxID=1676991 RepID=UPI000781888E|nr:flagellin [Clostridium sp. ATCC 25772]